MSDRFERFQAGSAGIRRGSMAALACLMVLAGLTLTPRQSADAADEQSVQPAAAQAAAPDPAARIDFASDILPILADKCFACHGVDAESREADLRLDHRENAVDVAKVIEPGDAAASLLVERITTRIKAERMPPASFKKTLKPEEIELLKRWIDQGAEYRPHWAFVSPTQAPLPEVKHTDWPVNAVDWFVLSKLESKGLSPAREADRRSLIRRVTLDLTGLPPTPEQADAFVHDTEPGAYERVVDRLLASPRYGEHMTRYWLDAVRYGDTHGLHLDNYREMWPYRDYLIRAFNQNMPFDRFTIEQIAGDLMPDATLDQQVASGYNRCHITTSEGGTIPEEVYVRNVIDRVETTSTVWLGLTAGCASCHDHKYDPITQAEFYELFAFFNSFDGNPRDNNNAAPPPVVRVPSEEAKAKLAEFDAQIEATQAKIAARQTEAEADYRAWLKARQNKENQPAPAIGGKGLLVHIPLDEAQGDAAANTAAPDAQPGRITGEARWTAGRSIGGFTFAGGSAITFGKDIANFEQDAVFSYGGWIRTPGNVTGAAIAKMDQANGYRGWDLYIDQRRVAMHLIHHWPDKTLKVTTQADVLKPDTWHHVFVTYDGSKQAKGVKLYVDGKPQPFDASHDTLEGTTVADVPLTLGRRSPDASFTGGMIDEVRLYDRVLSQDEVGRLMQHDAIAALLAVAEADRSPQQNDTLKRHYLDYFDTAYPGLVQQQAELQKQRDAAYKALPTTLVYKETKEPRKAYLLHRGQYDQQRDEVQRDVPDFLPPMAQDLPRDRYGLARWLVSPEHPLTARVTINRFWQQLFGVGLVKTSEDFGVQGEHPSHPQLLDYLAVQFVADGWDVKKSMKRMVMSATYRQTAEADPALYRLDPDNRLLARGPRLRLDAEVLRDQALAVSGLMNDQIGGASVKPPQPLGIWKAVGYESSNTANFKADTGEKVYRRSMYIFWKRTAPPPYMVALDAPNRESCVVRRERTNTPMQALILLNEPQYVESARRLSERLLAETKGDVAQRVGWLMRQVLVREPTDTERAILVEAYLEQLDYYRNDVEAAKALIATGTSTPGDTLDPAELAAWTMTANTMMNLDEFINKP